MGVTIERTDQEEHDVVRVWDNNWPSFEAFLACETQWQCVSRGVGGVLTWLGIDYAAADVVLRRRNAEDHAFADLQVMERAALDTFSEMAERGHG